MNRFAFLLICIVATLTTWFFSPRLSAFDTEATRKTLAGIKGVYVIVEDLQPNLQKYAKRQDLSKETLQKQVENQLRTAGITILSRDEWQKTLGCPLLYINVNTHEFQKYQFACNVQVQLRQLVRLEANAAVTAFAPTWSTHMTGIVNVGTANSVGGMATQLVRSFIEAYQSVSGATLPTSDRRSSN